MALYTDQGAPCEILPAERTTPALEILQVHTVGNPERHRAGVQLLDAPCLLHTQPGRWTRPATSLLTLYGCAVHFRSFTA